jgi:hypothetical protein
MSTSTSKPPAGIGKAGAKVWRAITSKYELRADELVTLEDVCAATDMIDELEREWIEDGRPMTTSGSMGQKVIHPLIGELRAQRAARNALWRQLKLPDDAGDAEGSNQHRDAAQSRWSKRGA